MACAADPKQTARYTVWEQPPRENVGRQDTKSLALFLPSLAGGGVARVMLHLATAFAGRGYRVDLVLCQVAGPYLRQLPAAVKVVGLQASPEWLGRVRALSVDSRAFGSMLLPVLLPYKAPQTVRYLPDLMRYLQREKPAAMLAAKTPANLAALWAKRLSGAPTRLVVSEHTNLSQVVQSTRKWRWRFVSPGIHRI